MLFDLGILVILIVWDSWQSQDFSWASTRNSCWSTILLAFSSHFVGLRTPPPRATVSTVVMTVPAIPTSTTSTRDGGQLSATIITRKGEGLEGGGSPGELGEGPGVVDLQRCWGCSEQSYQGRI